MRYLIVFLLSATCVFAQTKVREGSQTMGPLPAAQGGVPAGGTIEQILSKINGTDYNTHWVDKPTGGGVPGGSNTQVQFNDSNAFGGDAGFTYIKGTNTLRLTDANDGNNQIEFFDFDGNRRMDIAVSNIPNSRITLNGDSSNRYVEIAAGREDEGRIFVKDTSGQWSIEAGYEEVIGQDGVAIINLKRNNDVSPTGWFFMAQTRAGVPLFYVDIFGNPVLIPRAAPTPTPGMIYADTDTHFYGYNGTVFKQLDNDPTPTPTASATSTPTPTPTPTATAVTLTIAGNAQQINVDRTWALGHALGFTTDGGGVAIPTGVTGYFTTHESGTITGWSITAVGSSPTCTIDVWKIATGTALPTVANTIMGTKPALSVGNAKRGVCPTNCVGWTTSFADGDIFGFTIDAVTVATKITFQIEYTK